MISHKHKCIFIHIPKNAGSSVERAFGYIKHIKGKGKHDPAWVNKGYWHKNQIGREYPIPKIYPSPHNDPSYAECWDEYFKFAIVRNPWSRLVSSYKYDIQIATTDSVVENPDSASSEKWLRTRREFLKEFHDKHGDTFEGFVKSLSEPGNCHGYKWLGSDYAWVKWHGVSQITFIVDETRQDCMDMIIKMENLKEEWPKVCERIGADLELPHVNKAKGKRYTEYYNDETREIVAKRYAKDIEYFGYQFED